MYALVLKHAVIADGTGSPPYVGDICIQDGKIADILPYYDGAAVRTLDATGLVAAPGFIDIHSHSDTIPLQTAMEPESKLFQGVTLEITGNCGISHLPVSREKRAELTRFYNAVLPASVDNIQLEDASVSDFVRHVQEHPPATHYGVLIGHGTLRGAVMGFGMRPPAPEEQLQMEQLLDRQLEEGAFGMSLGLIYPPSSFARKDELVGLARVLAKRNAILAVHMRSESDRVFQAVEEMLEIARASGVRLEISHLKLMGRKQWGRTGELLAMLDRARSEGIQVTCDQYPYHASSTGLSALFPSWAHDGGVACLVRRAGQPTQELLDAIQAEMDRRGGPEAVLVVDSNGHLPMFHGKTIQEIASQWKVSPAQAAARFLAQCEGAVSCIYFTMDMDDVCRIMQDMHICVGSDGVNYEYAKAAGRGFHPRNFGTFPRFLQTVRERNLMPLEKAVYKMTGLPACILGLKDRGLIRPGMAADLTLFHPEQVADCATYTNSAVPPQGIPYVIVSGQLALDQGKQTSVHAGSVLMHQG